MCASKFVTLPHTTRCQSNGNINILLRANFKSLRLIDCVRERVAEDRMWACWEEVKRRLEKKSHIAGIHNLYPLPKVIRMVKLII